MQVINTELQKAGVESAGVFGDYASRVDLMKRMEGADILYFNRATQNLGTNNEYWYSSATMQLGMLLGIPIIANSDPGFSHCKDVAIIADTPDEVAAAIEKLRNPSFYAEAVQKIIRYREESDVVKIYSAAGVIC